MTSTSKRSLQRRGNTTDLAGACAFLPSDHAAVITGQAICVNGVGVMY